MPAPPLRCETRLSALLDQGSVDVGLRVESPDAAVEALLSPVLRREGLDEAGVAAALEAVRARERSGCTVIGHVAIPHARIPALTRIVAGLGLNPEGVWEDGPRIVLAFASPASAGTEHLRFLSCVAQILRNEGIVEELLGARDAGAVLHAVRSRER